MQTTVMTLPFHNSDIESHWNVMRRGVTSFNLIEG